MRTILSLICIFFTASGFSQSFEKLKSDVRKLTDANYNMDFETVASLTYPKVYDAIGKAAFIEKLDSDYQNQEYRMRLEIANPLFLYSEMKTTAGHRFYVITYKNPVRYFFENKLDAAAAAQSTTALKESANAYEVVFEPKRNSINVKRNSRLVAVSDSTTNGEWLFFNFDDPKQRSYFETAFDHDVKKALGL